MSFMKKFVVTICGALLASVLISTAMAADAADMKVLATVGPEVITQADLDQLVASLDPRQQGAAKTPAGREKLLGYLTDVRLFMLYGRELKLQNTPEFKEALAREERALLSVMAATHIMENTKFAPVTDEDAKKFYDEHAATFQVPAAVKASHILILVAKDAPEKDVKAARVKAMQLINDIRAGRITFEKAAKENSACPSKDRGGDLGFFQKGQMVAPFEEAAFKLKKGEMTKAPVRTDYGFHVIKVTDKHDADVRSFASVKNDIRAALEEQKKEQAVNAVKENLKKKYAVTILPDDSEKASKTSQPKQLPKK